MGVGSGYPGHGRPIIYRLTEMAPGDMTVGSRPGKALMVDAIALIAITKIAKFVDQDSLEVDSWPTF